MNSPPPLAVYLGTWVALMALLTGTFASAHYHLGEWNVVINMAISVAKTALVALFFMHLRRAPAVLVIFAATGLFALSLLFGLSATDYATRDPSPAPWSSPTLED